MSWLVQSLALPCSLATASRLSEFCICLTKSVPNLGYFLDETENTMPWILKCWKVVSLRSALSSSDRCWTQRQGVWGQGAYQHWGRSSWLVSIPSLPGSHIFTFECFRGFNQICIGLGFYQIYFQASLYWRIPFKHPKKLVYRVYISYSEVVPCIIMSKVVLQRLQVPPPPISKNKKIKKCFK